MEPDKNQSSPFYKDTDENSSKGYDPCTDLFSDAPYDIGTDMPVQPRLPKPHVRVSTKKELRKLIIPFIISFFLVLPFTVVLTFYIKFPVFSILIPEYYLLIALYSLSWIAVIVGGISFVRANSRISLSGFTGVRTALLPFYLTSSGLCIASLIVPESTEILLKLVCIALLAGTAVLIFITARKKGNRTEKKLFIIPMTAMLLLSIGFNCVSKLFMTAINTDTRYIVLTMRDSSSLPAGDDRHRFVGTGEQDPGICFVNGIVVGSREDFLYYSDKTDAPEATRFLAKNHDAFDDEIIAADNIIVNALHDLENIYTEDFFANNYLVIRSEYFYDHIADINLTDMRANLDRMFYALDVDYTASEDEFISDVCLFLMAFPKSSDPWKYKIQSIKYVETMNGTPYNQ